MLLLIPGQIDGNCIDVHAASAIDKGNFDKGVANAYDGLVVSNGMERTAVTALCSAAGVQLVWWQMEEEVQQWREGRMRTK